MPLGESGVPLRILDSFAIRVLEGGEATGPNSFDSKPAISKPYRSHGRGR